jgi:hypothetical protein
MLYVADKGARVRLRREPRSKALGEAEERAHMPPQGWWAWHTPHLRREPSQTTLDEDPEQAPRVGRCHMGGCNGIFKKYRLRREPSPAALGEDPERVPRVGHNVTRGAAEFFFKKTAFTESQVQRLSVKTPSGSHVWAAVSREGVAEIFKNNWSSGATPHLH